MILILNLEVLGEKLADDKLLIWQVSLRFFYSVLKKVFDKHMNLIILKIEFWDDVFKKFKYDRILNRIVWWEIVKFLVLL